MCTVVWYKINFTTENKAKIKKIKLLSKNPIIDMKTVRNRKVMQHYRLKLTESSRYLVKHIIFYNKLTADSKTLIYKGLKN